MRKDKVKHYDKEIYKMEERLKGFILILVIFVGGFLVGNWCKNAEYENIITEKEIEIIDLQEQKYQLERKWKKWV